MNNRKSRLEQLGIRKIEEQLIIDNILRKHLTDYQRGEIGKLLEPILKMRRGHPKKVEENFTEPIKDKGQTRDKVAEELVQEYCMMQKD